MLLTEQEAREKWCPFTRNGNQAGCNRSGTENGLPLQYCIASECMAWRHGPRESRTIETVDVPQGQLPPGCTNPQAQNDDGSWWSKVTLHFAFPPAPGHDRWERYCLERRGYCGLAGKAGD